MTSYARYATGKMMSDPATLSCFHELIKNYNAMPEYSRPQYDEEGYLAVLRRQERAVGNLPVSEAKKRKLLERLGKAREEGMPSQSIMFAMNNITRTLESRTRRLSDYLSLASSRSGIPQLELLERFKTLEAGTERSRSIRFETYPERSQRLMTGLGMGRDVGVMNALTRIEEEVSAVEIVRANAMPRRIALNEMDSGHLIGLPGIAITGWGWDGRNNRLEVRIRENGTDTVYAYAGVGESLSSTITDDNVGEVWAQEIRGVSPYQYENEREAALAGAAPKCEVCGQFANNRHDCPARTDRPTRMNRWMNSEHRWSRQTVNIATPMFADGYGEEPTFVTTEQSVHLPPVREFRTRVAQGPIQLDVDASFPSAMKYMNSFHEREMWRSCDARLRGSLVAYRDENEELHINKENLRCTCEEYRLNQHCLHIDGYVSAVTTRLDPPPRVRRAAGSSPRGRLTQADREAILVEAQRRSEAAATTDWTRSEAGLAEARALWNEEAEVSYFADYSAFKADVEAARSRIAAKDNKTPSVQYMRENAMGGYATREAGDGFGMEIEFTIKEGVNNSQALTAIAQELYDAGIAHSPVQEGYRASKRRGYTDKHTDENGVGTWSFEHDGSVDGELVTPIMYDEPETWEKLEKALEIIKRNGGEASRKAGAHVHVGTKFFEGDPSRYAELAKLMNQHEDVVYRLATSPIRGKHRNNGYAKPLSNVTGFRSINEVSRLSYDRYMAINFSGVTGGESDHPEFRIFDATLDPGTMQAQAKMAVAMTHAAKRIADTTSTIRHREEFGAHYRRQAARGTRLAMSDSEEESDSATLRSFIDTVFTRREDKAQMAAIYAFTKWTASRNRRY